MKNVGQCYAQRMNIRLDRKGPLWEGRFRSAVVNSHRHLLACYRYIELNPVRAGLVPRPEHYRWSSYLFNAFGHSSPVLVPQEIYKQLGASTDERATVYRELFEQPMEPEMLEEIRTATSGGFVMGAARRRRGRPRRLLVGM